MNDARRELRRVPVSRSINRPQSREAVAASPHLDEEFGDFFNQGDAGEYEGGVAYSQPPSKPLADLAELSPSSRTIQQQARRARYVRLVGFIVAGCVFLLFVAVRFKPHAGIAANIHEVRHSVPLLQRESAVARPPWPAQDQAGRPVGKPAAVAAAAVIPLPIPDVPKPAASAQLAQPRETHFVAKEPAPSVLAPAAIQQSRAKVPVPAILAARTTPAPAVLARHKPKASSPDLRDKPAPIAPIAPVAVRNSVVAFPVD